MELSLKDISVTLSGEEILKSIDLTIEDGAIISLLGASGCGKSTLLKTIAGIITPSGGSVFLNGSCADNLPPHRRGTVIVFQDLRLFPHMTVADNISFPLKMRGVSKEQCRKTAVELLEKVQLEGYGERKINEMSGGQLQRVALARALAAKPNVLLLDEPFSSLDENLRQDMRKLVLKLQKEYRITTILVTHDRQEALCMSDRIALMKSGKILQYDTPERIYHAPASREVADFFSENAYIDGTVTDHAFTCDIAAFRTEMPDGPYQAVLRPGAVRIGPWDGKRDFQVTEISYRGEDYGISLKDQTNGLVLNTSVPSPCMFKVGDLVSVQLDQEKIILLPR